MNPPRKGEARPQNELRNNASLLRYCCLGMSVMPNVYHRCVPLLNEKPFESKAFQQ